MHIIKKMEIVMFIMLILPVAASAAPNESLMKPGMGSAWLAEQGADVQELLNWVLGALIVATIVAYIFFTSAAGIQMMGHSTTMGDPHQKSQGQMGIVYTLFALVCIVLFIRIGTQFFGWY